MGIRKIDTIIIGGGQAGLAVSYCLGQRGLQHIVLEQAAQAANAWRNDRWDSFTLVTPNWSFRLPGAEYQGDQPDSFMPKSEIVAHLELYVERFRLPVHYNTLVTAVEQNVKENGYLVSTVEALMEARNVVVATGLYQKPKLPSFAGALSSRITQVHSRHYRNPQALPEGAVLVAGSGQSGCQIAQELYQCGRKVYLCVGSAGRAPRRYRGKDIYEWLKLTGFIDRTPDKLRSPQEKFASNPLVSGKDGGMTLNLHQFARDGVTLLGRLQDARDEKVWLAADLKENLAKSDKKEVEIVGMIDEYIQKNGIGVPPETLSALRDGYDLDEILELDLQVAGITTIIWAMGYAFDFSMVKFPIFDNDGFPIQKRGATAYPGLFFVGLPWLYKQKSGHLFGVGEDAEYIASLIAAR